MSTPDPLPELREAAAVKARLKEEGVDPVQLGTWAF